MNSRKIFLDLVTGLLSLFLLTGLAGSAERVRFATSLKSAPGHILPPLAAEEKGFWKEQGLEAEWLPFDSGTAMYHAVAAGSVDMGASGAISQIQAAARGIPILIAADLQHEEGFFIWVRSDSPIRQPKDLKGARIGIARLGGSAYAYGKVMIRGLGLEKDVKLVAGGGATQQLAALKAGALDASVSQFFPIAPLKYRGEVREVAAVRSYLPREWVDLVIFARKELIESRPKVVNATLKAILQATDFIQRDREWAVEKMKSRLGYQDDWARDSYRFLRYGRDGKINIKGLENVLAFLIKYGIISKEKAPVLQELYTGRFLD